MKKKPLMIFALALAVVFLPMPWWLRFPASLVILATAIAFAVRGRKEELGK